MRILQVENSLEHNGAIQSSLERAQRWQRLGAAVTLFVAQPARAEKMPVRVPDGIRAVAGASVNAPVLPGAAGQALYGVHRRADLVQAFARGVWLARRSDVVVSGQEMDRGLLAAALVAWAARRPLAVSVRSNMEAVFEYAVPPAWQARTRWALRSADAAVGLSRGMVPGLVRLGVAPERAHVVYNGVEADRIRRRSDEAPEIDLPDGPFVVSVGRLTWHKGMGELIRAHARALQGGAPPHTLLLLGEGKHRAELEALAREQGVGQSVRMPGYVVNPHPIVARADLFVLASWWEGFSRVLAEALLLGVPIVSVDCVSGPSEVLNGGAYGRLVPERDVEALAAAVAEHLHAPDELRRRAARGAQDTERFDPQRRAEEHLALLQQIAAAGRRGTA